jgi:hypothetical protein
MNPRTPTKPRPSVKHLLRQIRQASPETRQVKPGVVKPGVKPGVRFEDAPTGPAEWKMIDLD